MTSMNRAALRLDQINFTYPATPKPLFLDAHAHLTSGWTAIVGENGAGKTTLMKLISGDLTPSSGKIHHDPTPMSVALCPQRVVLEDDLSELAANTWTNHAMRIKSSLMLDNAWEQWNRWETLSPGERKRLQIAGALIRAPEILLLDEPTNHIDASTRDVLASALASFQGIGVIVSHDRAFLDELCAHILWLERDGTITSYASDFSNARLERSRRRDAIMQRRDALSAQRSKLASRLEREHAQRARADRSINARSRMTSIKDSDARSMGAKARAMKAAAKHSQAARSTRTELDLAEQKLSDTPILKDPGRSLHVDWTPSPKTRLATLITTSLQAGEQVLASELSLTWDREDRVWLRGPNGAGKSTLLAALKEQLHVPTQRILYLPQTISEEDVAATLQRLATCLPEHRSRWMNILAALGTPPERILAANTLSPGESRKLALAEGLASDCWGVILDEPTNHLDLPSIERLEAALTNYPGALLIVTHDTHLGRACAHETWDIPERGGRITRAPIIHTE